MESTSKRLLILTQSVDRNDPVLGFFHGWIAAFSKLFDIHVVCLTEGDHSLPANVRIHSLGKEHGASKLAYVANFYRYAWRLRHDYDAVFVHMNQEYVLLGGLLWKTLGKKVYLWRNHYRGGVITDIAVALSDRVFCTSRFSYTAKSSKARMMPVGIDTHVFRPMDDVTRVPRSILFLSRFAPSKHPDILIDALAILHARNIPFTASIYGSSLPKDRAFHESQKGRVTQLGLSAAVHFSPGVPNHKTPRIYGAHEICVDASASGMYNKTMFEAAACGVLVVAASKDLAEHVPGEFIFAENDPHHLAEKLEIILSMPEKAKEASRGTYRSLAESNSLDTLRARLAQEIR